MAPASELGSVEPADDPTSFSCIISGGVELSPLDTLSYRYLKLQNELNAIIVSDTLYDKAVGVGYFSDPWEIPGFAHFTEHMCFLGTEKYPDESSYYDFMARYSGFASAGTGHENTNSILKCVYNLMILRKTLTTFQDSKKLSNDSHSSSSAHFSLSLLQIVS